MATSEKASSFLAGVKAEITDLFASAYDEIASDFGEDVPPVIGETMQKLQKKTWGICELRMKESFLNGKKAGGGPSAKDGARRPPAGHDAPSSTDGNPFRRS